MARDLRQRRRVQAAHQAALAALPPPSVAALGSIVPGQAVIHLNAPASSGEARLQTLTVQQNELVAKNQVIGTLDSIQRLQAAVAIATSQVAQKQASLDRVRAGNSAFQIGAQQATVEKLRADATRQEFDIKRYKTLHDQGIVSDTDYENRVDIYNQAQQSLRESEQTYKQVQEVRPVDLEVARADSLNAQASLQSARADVEQGYIRAPQEGRILHIYTFPGEKIGDQGILDMAPTHEIFVEAEVYETDLARVHDGQSATITGAARPSALHGRVTLIEQSIGRQQVVTTDPAANTDARVAVVRVQLDPASQSAAEKLINLQVKVEFAPR